MIYSLCLHRCSSHPTCCSPFYDDWRRYHGNESSRQPDAWPAREADSCLQPAADAVECSAGPVQYVGHRRRRPFLRPDRTRRSRISTATLVTLFTGFLIGLGSGINALVARFLGAGSREETQRTVHTALALSLIFGAVLLLLGELTAVPLLKLLGTKEELIDGATIYLRIYFLGMPAMALYNFGNAVLSAAGDTRRPLLYLLIAGILNVALNLFFVIVCGMSADGVALASILTQYLSSILILIALVRTQDAYGVRPKCIRLHRDKLAPLLTLCCSAGLQNAIFAVANLFIQAGVNRFDALMVEGNSAAANADGLIYDVMAAFHTACASFIGQNYGAGNRDRVRRTYWISLSYSFAAGAVLGLSLVFFGRGFLALFTDSAEVAAAGMHRLCIMGFSYAISAFMDCTIAASRGLGRCVVPTIIVVLGSCVFRVIWVYTIFASVGTIASLYLLYPVSWTLTAGAEMVYFFYLYRKVFRNPAKPATV